MAATGSDSVTVVVTRQVKAGREAAYEAWLRRLIADAGSMPGFLGATEIIDHAALYERLGRWPDLAA